MLPAHVKIYVVGGAVRDVLLSKKAKDLDYVVVGATPADMLAAGYTQVGADFPVFLHPETKEEYALARTERKTGSGYHGFETRFDPTVTLEDDLRRRDITINAMAVRVEDWDNFCNKTMSPSVYGLGLIDPFNGRRDLMDKRLHPVSDAFAEDPLRVLRAARFAARYKLKQTDEMTRMVRNIVMSGELYSLTPERVWVELVKAVEQGSVLEYLEWLDNNRCLDILYHGVNVTQWLKASFGLVGAGKTFDAQERMAMLTVTMVDEQTVRKFYEKLKAPNEFKDLALTTWFLRFLTEGKYTPAYVEEHIVMSLHDLGAFRNVERTLKGLRVLMELVPQFDVQDNAWFLISVLPKLAEVGFANLTATQQATLKGKEVGRAINDVRVQMLRNALFLADLKG